MQVEAQKPSWQTGSTAPLNLAGNIKAKGDSAQKEHPKLQLNLEDDGGEEMIDEDALLTEEDYQRPTPGSCYLSRISLSAQDFPPFGKQLGWQISYLFKDILAVIYGRKAEMMQLYRPWTDLTKRSRAMTIIGSSQSDCA